MLEIKSGPGLPRALPGYRSSRPLREQARPFCPSFLCTVDQALYRPTGATAQQQGPLHRMPTSHNAPNFPQVCPESSPNSFPRPATLGFQQLCHVLSPSPILCHPLHGHAAQDSGIPRRIGSAALQAPPLLSEGGIISLPTPTALL